MSEFLNWPQRLSPVAMIGSAVFSMLIGVFFGFYPAKKAAALDPIEAFDLSDPAWPVRSQTQRSECRVDGCLHVFGIVRRQAKPPAHHSASH